MTYSRKRCRLCGAPPPISTRGRCETCSNAAQLAGSVKGAETRRAAPKKEAPTPTRRQLAAQARVLRARERYAKALDNLTAALDNERNTR